MPAKEQIVHSPDALPVLPIFSQAVVSRPDKALVFASGNIGMTPEFKLVEGGVKEQTRAALTNLQKVLKAAGSGLEHIVKANVYLTNMKADFGPMNEAYAEFFSGGNMPARTCIGVAELPFGAAMEIECTAEVVN